MALEQQARVSKNTLLQQEGWNVCYTADANIHAGKCVIKGVALARLPLNNGFGFAEGCYPRGLPPSLPAQIRIIAEVDLNMNRDMRFRQSILQTAFSYAKGT
jgi:hypothetical protein